MKKELVIWKKKWETGIKTIDEQHKHFVELINQAYSFNRDKKDKYELESIINELIEFARIHFSTEEKYFDETYYPQTEVHKAKHEQLLFKVLNFKNRFEAKEDFSIFVNDFLEFLRDWLDNHLIKVDHQYIPWLKDHGIR